MNQQDRQDEFCELLTRYQGQLHGYIFALVRNHTDADDLFQATSLVLWRKFDLFQRGTNFFAWARRAAEFEVRNFLRANRARFSPLTEALLSALTAATPGISDSDLDSYLAGLRNCVNKLSNEDRELLGLCYVSGLNTQKIADRVGRSRQSVGNSLMRIRRKLFHCIERQVAREDRP